MHIAPDLFDSVVPPAIWVTLHECEPALTDDRLLTVRVKPFAQRSFTLKARVSNYSPEDSIFRALAAWVRTCHQAQGTLTRQLADDLLSTALVEYVEPF